MKLPVRQRLRVHLDTGRSIEGVLMTRRGPYVRLDSAQVEVSGKLVDSGSVMIPLARVEFVQVLG